VLAGDVNGSSSVTTADITLIRRLILGASIIQAKSKPKAQLVVGSGRDLGDGVTVHLVTLRGVRSLTSLQFTLAWDPAEASYVGIEAGALKDLSPENLGTARAGQGLVSVSWDPANGVARDLGGEAIVLGLKLKARPGRTLSRLTVPERPTALG
jgi:hypothetical protein